MPIIVIETREDFAKALAEAGNKLVVVDFTAKWCGPCRVISPAFHQLSEEYTNCVFLKVDVDDASDVAQDCNVSCMPTFHFYKNKAKVGEFSGAQSAKLKEMVKSLQ